MSKLPEDIWNKMKSWLNERVPEPSSNAAPYYTTGDKYDDLEEALKFGYSLAISQPIEGKVMEPKKILAPFTTGQMMALIDYQNDPKSHPYTCPEHSNTPLAIGTTGMLCGVCGYKQDWALEPKLISHPAQQESIVQGIAEGSEEWRNRCENAELILARLVNLKEIKDSLGKTDFYEKNQPLTWDAARKHLENHFFDFSVFDKAVQPKETKEEMAQRIENGVRQWFNAAESPASIPETKNEPDWKAIAQDTAKRLSDGRDYLMQVEAKKINVADALEAFGFGRSGLNF